MAVRSDGIPDPPDLDKKPEDGIDCKTTRLEWCDEYIRNSAGCGNGSSAMQHKNNVLKSINEYLGRIGKGDILLKDATTECLVLI